MRGGGCEAAARQARTRGTTHGNAVSFRRDAQSEGQTVRRAHGALAERGERQALVRA